jgi:hypothetical protein
MPRLSALLALVLVASLPAGAAPVEALPGTRPLEEPGDLSDLMLDGIHRFADRKIAESAGERAAYWRRDASSAGAYERSIEPNRQSLRRILGVVDPRVPPSMERFGNDAPALVAEGDGFSVFQVRWPVLAGVHGEGLLLEPRAEPRGLVVILPDADQTPEQLAGLAPGVPAASQIPRRLASRGFVVLVPTLISRGVEFSGNPRVAMTNQPHREWIYRQAYQMGHHVLGYEVQKVLAAVDWIEIRGSTRLS